MKNKNKSKKVVKTEKIKMKYILQELIKKILAASIIVTNLFFYVPTATFAAEEEEDTDKKIPATVPAVANEIISKFVSTNIDVRNFFSI